VHNSKELNHPFTNNDLADTALQTYIRCRKENKEFAHFIKGTAKHPERPALDANDYLSNLPISFFLDIDL